jgi:hypothetical protein
MLESPEFEFLKDFTIYKDFYNMTSTYRKDSDFANFYEGNFFSGRFY